MLDWLLVSRQKKDCICLGAIKCVVSALLNCAYCFKAYWCSGTPVTLTFGLWKQDDQEFKVILSSIVSPVKSL